MTHQHKRDLVARIAMGADAMGVDRIYVAKEPYRIASVALEVLPLTAEVIEIPIELAHNATDTERAVLAFCEAGVDTFVSLGGDGTNRAITRATSEIDLIPLSTGTNNVFPSLVEPTLAGMVAGLNATGQLDGDNLDHARPIKQRAKVLRVRTSDGTEDLGLIDAVYLADDRVGNRLPFDEAKIKRLLLTQALPDAIGMSPIGGYFDVVTAADDCGLLVDLGGEDHFQVPLSPGLFQPVSVSDHHRVDLGAEVTFEGDGVLALDGDRLHPLGPDQGATVRVVRDGPTVIDVPAAMRFATAQQLLTARRP